MTVERDETSGREDAAADPRPARAGRRAAARLCLYGFATFAALLALAGALLVARLEHGPMTISGLGPAIAKALDQRFGHGYAFSIGETSMLKRGYSPTLAADGLRIRDAAGRTLLNAPRAEVSVELLPLVFGKVSPKRLEVFGVELRLALLPDGSIAQLAKSAASGADAQPDTIALTPPLAQSLGDAPAAGGAANEANAPAPKPRSLLVRQMSGALRLLIDALTDPASQIAAVDHAAIKDGRIVIDDRTMGQTIVFNGVDLAFDKTKSGTTFSLSVEGPNGRWSANGTASGAPGAQRRLTASLHDLSIDELLVAAGARSIGVDFDMKLSAAASVGMRPDGVLSEAAASFSFGEGYLRFDDPQDEPMLVESIRGGAHWDGAKRRVVVEPTRLIAADAHGAISGFVALPEREGDPFTLSFGLAEPIVAAPERPRQKPVTIDGLDVSARLLPNEKKLTLDRFTLSGPQSGFSMSGDVDWSAGLRLRLSASLDPTPIAVVTRLWPSFMCAPVRNYLLDHAPDGMVRSGTLRLDFTGADLEAMRNEHAPPDGSLAIDFTVSGGAVEFLDGAPPLTGIDGVGHVTGRSSRFTTTSAAMMEIGGRVLTTAPGGYFLIANSEPRPIPASIVADVSGSVEAVGELLSRPALKPYAALPLDPATLQGEVAGRLEIGLRLGPDMGPHDTTLRVNATATNFGAANLIGKEALEAATLTIAVDPSGLRASGQGRLFGAPATLDLVQPAGKPASGVVRTTLDDAARTRQGASITPGVTGPIGAVISAQLGGGPSVRADVDLDLAKAVIDWPGASKPAGRPGRAKFTAIVNEGATTLDQVTLDAGPLQARGQMEIGADGALLSAKFPSVKFSTGDDARLDALRAGDSIKVILRAQTLDARPFLKTMLASPGQGGAGGAGGGASAQGPARDIDVDARAAVLTGYNKQALTGFEMMLLKRGEKYRQLSFAGRFGRDTLSGNLTSGGQLTVLSDDAGSLLLFSDLYRHMEHGRLRADLTLDDPMTGSLTIESFVLRDEPALRRIVAEGASADGRLRGIDSGAMAFHRLQARFERAGTRIVLRDGVLNGDAIGLTVEGWLDFARDGVDVKGTFVPAYAVNNLFSQIPVVGAILGGSTNEGLIGVNYRVEGKISAPSLSINPLSAIAPGIFRQIFGVGQSGATPGGASATPAPAGAGR
ncbi:AsmA-like C-terminal region-containing protein [Methylocella sp.]|uniref:YhdP family protein n=1 Tax=Methylocella sp. TaxID=1978226 RepID=UPI003784808A